MDKQVDQKKKESGSGLLRRLLRGEVVEDVSSNSNLRAERVDDSLSEMASSSSSPGDISVSSEEYVRYNRSLLSLQPWIFHKANYKEDWERMERGDYESNGRRRGSSGASLGRRRTRKYYVEPLNSVGNPFLSQLCNEHLIIDDYVFSSLPSSLVSTLSPLLITDQNRIISRSCYDSLGIQTGNGQLENTHGYSSNVEAETLIQKDDEVSSGVLGTLIGVPSLPELEKPKRKIREVSYGRLNIVDSQRSHKFSNSKGSLDGMHLFCLGISLGMIFTVFSKRLEVENLNKLLKHSEELVQDLHEELEMKGSLTVQELVHGTCRSQEVNSSCPNGEEYIDLLLDQNPSSHVTANERDSMEKPQSLSKIEAELEAELERLEQNINTCDLQRRISELSELDADLIGDVIQGELRADMFDQDTRGGMPAGNNSSGDGTFTGPTYNANYSVSPKELSLRLHEVIQMRLMERINELETALSKNQRQLQIAEAELASSQRVSSISDIGSSSNQESPRASSHPLSLNLSGDALYAYEEAHEELAKITETRSPPSSLQTSKWVDGHMLNRSDPNLVWAMDTAKGNKLLKDSIFEKAPGERILSSRESNGMIEGGRDYSEGDVSDDEEGRQLIQQIIEKTRQGSPAVLYAQRMVSLMDELI